MPKKTKVAPKKAKLGRSVVGAAERKPSLVPRPKEHKQSYVIYTKSGRKILTSPAASSTTVKMWSGAFRSK
jgi:hypothetical protein